jgi:large subunit ribosomal protein L21
VYAVLVTGGKQYKAQVGQVLTVEKLDVPAGQDVQFDQVLLISDDSGVTVGAPVIAGATVRGRVVRQDRGEKIIVFKYKPKVRYRRKTGHRQSQTHVLVQAIRSGNEPEQLDQATPAGTGAVEEPVDLTPVETGAFVDTAPALHAEAEPTDEMAYPAPVEAGEDDTRLGDE